jgi:hypothetical protein
VKVLAVVLEGIANILKCGGQFYLTQEGENKFAIEFERVGGLDMLEPLQIHEN